MKKRTITLLAMLLLVAILSGTMMMQIGCENSDDVQPDEQTEQPTIEVDELKIGIISDIQLLTEGEIEDPTSFQFTHYCSFFNVCRMLELSEAILATAVDELIAQKVDVVLVTGDLSETGTTTSLQAAANELQRLKDAGIPTYVINGDCDYHNPLSMFFEEGSYAKAALKSSFAKIFADFGFNEAVSRDENSLSYAVDIPGKNYRLIAIDASFLEEVFSRRIHLANADPSTVGDEQLYWIEKNLLDAQIHGKEAIVMVNTPLSKLPVSFYTDFNIGAYNYVTNGSEVQELLAEYGVKYVFTGHIHCESTMTVQTKFGELTEEYTSCLAGYPNYIKFFTINNDYSYTKTTKSLATLKEEYLPSYIDASTKAKVTTDFRSYCKARFYSDFVQLQTEGLCNEYCDGLVNVYLGEIEEYVPGIDLFIGLLRELQIYPTGDSAKDAVLEDWNEQMMNWALDTDHTMLYSGADSVEAIARQYGDDMPRVAEYANYTVNDYIMDLFMRMLDGRYTYNETDEQIFTCIFTMGIYRIKDIPLFNTLHEVNDLVMACKLDEVLENYLQTGVLDLKQDEFLLALISLFQPYLQGSTPLRFNFSNTEALLKGFANLIPFLSYALPELELFLPGGVVDTDYFSFTKGELYGKPLISQIMFPVLSRTAIII